MPSRSWVNLTFSKKRAMFAGIHSSLNIISVPWPRPDAFGSLHGSRAEEDGREECGMNELNRSRARWRNSAHSSGNGQCVEARSGPAVAVGGSKPSDVAKLLCAQ